MLRRVDARRPGQPLLPLVPMVGGGGVESSLSRGAVGEVPQAESTMEAMATMSREV